MRRNAPIVAVLAALALGGCVPASAYDDHYAYGYGNTFGGYPAYGSSSYGYPFYGYPSYGSSFYGNTLFGYPAFGYRTFDGRRARIGDHDGDDRERYRRREENDHDDYDHDRNRDDRPRDFLADESRRHRDQTTWLFAPAQVQGVRPDDDDSEEPHPYTVAAPTHSHWWGPK